MKIYIWRHNRKYHSWSMMNEPCVHQDAYTDAIAIVMAETEEQAIAMLAKEKGWRTADVQRLAPKALTVDQPQIIFSEVRGD